MTNFPLVSWWGYSIGLVPSTPSTAAGAELGRTIGAHAELAALKASALAHEAKGELDHAAQLWAELAHCFSFKKSRHDAAIAHARRSLALREASSLREELAQWLEGIGCWSDAARLLHEMNAPRSALERARWHQRLASLWWRAGELEQAAQALAEVARIDADCTEPLELLAGLHASAPHVVSRERAVLAQLEAARRYQQRGARLAAFEAELRAFEIDPSSVLATEQLAISLNKLGRREAAEDIWRLCAQLASDKSLFQSQIDKALGRDEFDRALGAGLDSMADTALSVGHAAQAAESSLQPYGAAPRTFDGVLARARLFGWLAARLEMALVESRARDQSRAWILLTRVYASAMGWPELAAHSLARALAVDPVSSEMRRMLDAFAEQGGASPCRFALVDALRIGVSPEVAARLAGEVIEAIGAQPVPNGLATWANETLRQGASRTTQDSSNAEWQVCAQQQREEWAEVLRSLDAMPTRDEQLQTLQRVAVEMALDPGAMNEERDALLAWLGLQPDSSTALRRLAQLIEVLSWRISSEPIAESWVRVLNLLSKQGGEIGVITVASYWLRQGGPEQALAVLREAIHRPEPSQRLLGWALTLARRMSDRQLAAEASTLIAKGVEPSIAAVLLAHAAEVFLDLNDVGAARRSVDAGLALTPTSARLVGVDVRLQDGTDSRKLAETLERALGVIPPRGQFAFQLAQAHQNLGNPELALAWAQRASTLQPATSSLRDRVAELAVAANDSSRLAEWLLRSIDVPAPIDTWLPIGVTVLLALVSIDAPRAAEVARRLVASTGAADSQWRDALLAAADAVNDARLALDILERAVAAGHDIVSALKEIVRRRLSLGDFESAYDAASRAIKAGVSREQVREWVPQLFENDCYQVADTELAAAELAWELTRTGIDAESMVGSMRRLAKARFVLARDESGAFEMWSALLNLEQVDLISIVANDMVPSCGHSVSVQRLLDWANAASEPRRKAAFCVAIAYLYAQVDEGAQSRAFVERAQMHDASNVDALLIAESQIRYDDDRQWLEEVYAAAESATFGRHGNRALHYRAAKVFEGKGELERALRHACAAFVAIPSAGVVFRLMASLARVLGDAQPFVDAVWHVASRSVTHSDPQWVALAVEALEEMPGFLSARFELLLRALTIDSSVGVVRKAAQVARMLLESSASDGEIAGMRLGKALRAKLDVAKGPQGARLALVTAATAASLHDSALCAQSLLCAFRCDADVDEYEEVEATVQWLGDNAIVSRALLDDVLRELDKPYINVGFAAVKILGWVQLAGGDAESLQRLIELVSRLGQYDQLLAWLSEIIGRASRGASGSEAVLHELVRVRLQHEELDDALELLSTIIAGNPRSELAHASARRGVDVLTVHRDLGSARRWLQSVRDGLAPVQAATLELHLARQAGDGLPLVRALSHLAYSDPNSPAVGMGYLQEATTLAEQFGYTEEALECAKSAVAWDPSHPGAQLQLAAILYKLRNREGDDHADEIVSGLRKVPVQNDARDEELRAFLLAEALDATYGTGAGIDELVRAHERFGNRPLLALGLAERLVLAGDTARALPLFGDAIDGDLRGLRSRSAVCLEAARVARNQEQLALAQQWLQKAVVEPDCPAAVNELATEIKRELQARQPRLSSANISREAPVERRSSVASTQPKPDESNPQDDDSIEIPLVRKRTDKPPSTPRPNNLSRPSSAISIEPEPEPDTLTQAVARARVMVERESPSYETLTVLRRWLRRWPASVQLMELVRDAAFVERDIPLSRAVEHARGVLLRLSERIEPPELGAQPIVPEAVRLLLGRDLSTPVGDAMARLWEGAEHLIQKDLLDYGVTGLDRVVPNAANILWQAASEIAPRLDCSKVPLFYQRSAEQITAQIALSNPPALVLHGELPRNLRDLTGLLGASLWITQPEYSLLMGAPAADVKAVLLALQLAFGPPQRHPMTNMSASLRLAEKLWECIPSSAQRHLRELCLDALDYPLARERAEYAQRRAGLYATGDLYWALADLSHAEGRDVIAQLAVADSGERVPRAEDLLRLATSAEYAAVRWQPARGSERRIDVAQR